jgi:PAS domain S-box-containing protein
VADIEYNQIATLNGSWFRQMSIPVSATPRTAPSVRFSLAALVLGCVLPMAAVAVFLVLQFYESERAQIIAGSVNRARAIMSEVERDFDSTQAALYALSTSRQLEAGELAGFHARASEVLGNLRADSILLLAPDGSMLMTTRRPFGSTLPRLEKTPLLARTMATGRAGISDLFVGPLAGRPLYTIAVPIKRDGVTVLSLNATSSPTFLSQTLAQQNLPPSWRASVLDSTGHVAARTHDIDKFAGRRVPEQVMQRLAQSDEGAMEATTLDGIPVITVFSRSAGSRWSVVIGIPRDELTGNLRHTLAWLVGATLAALAVGLASAWRVGGGIVRSMQALLPPALAVARGEVPDVGPAPLPVREADAVRRAMLDAGASVRQARAATRESEQRLALVADAANMGIWVRDLVRHEIWVSEQWRALFEFTPQQQITLELLLQRVHPDDRAAVARTLESAAHGAPRYDMEYRVLLAGGATRWIGSHGSTECDADDRPALVRGVSLDITKRKQAEFDVQNKQKEVMHLARVAMLGELSGALAHELNQPLTAILSNAQAAQRFMSRTPVDLAEVAEILQDIVDENKRAGEIIQRLRRLFDKNEAQRVPLAVDELLSGVQRILRNDLIGHGVALQLELEAGPLAVSADRVQLQQVLINLLMNACDAMGHVPREARVVRLRVVRQDGQVLFSVSDRGTGMDAATLAHVFDPFFTTKQRGMGLGLSICRTIVNAHEGRLWAENNPDGGATFHLLLPLQVVPEPQPREQTA